MDMVTDVGSPSDGSLHRWGNVFVTEPFSPSRMPKTKIMRSIKESEIKPGKDRVALHFTDQGRQKSHKSQARDNTCKTSKFILFLNYSFFSSILPQISGFDLKFCKI